MIVTKKALPRRTFLRGTGAALALPLLDAMIPSLTALADTPANPAKLRRLGFVYMPMGCDVTRWTPPGGETLDELNARVHAACADLAAEPVDGHVVVVTHVSPLKSAVAWALDVGEELSWRLFVAPGSITRIDRRDDRCVLVSFNEVGHLL